MHLRVYGFRLDKPHECITVLAHAHMIVLSPLFSIKGFGPDIEKERGRFKRQRRKLS